MQGFRDKVVRFQGESSKVLAGCGALLSLCKRFGRTDAKSIELLQNDGTLNKGYIGV